MCIENHELYEAAFNFITHPANERVLFGVMKRLNVRVHDTYYEDVISEGRIIYAAVYVEYVTAKHEFDAEKLRRYAYQRLYWRLLDYLRNHTRSSNHQTPLTDAMIAYLPDPQTAGSVETSDLFTRIALICDVADRRLLSLLMQSELNMSQIARQLGVSRPTLYKRRRILAAKLAHYLPDLRQ
ncbi:sigma-70 family RNA polymerase sigma factor [Furfurilactobacillus siliginis]|uniref:DNA binding HTH domain-containing protein n=1 Tax=Furfurilactobacillus siliginis TaxID=348151 RepID=A0A0R2L3J9_9LACO|nr:sigma-70 family RNA polymerase sigma factor [Furfurilactobacillus siliginis]KRN96161.1 hypothetical protein IV55_GL001547 [Furfurilactobacillus siliginis]GEK27914.1 hypothetical protein LSI01_02250 [Furfurilactobacillus siliginis]